ncbi:MAG: hypothetical protein ACOYL3_23190, partial [Desulfuromonadaceae bacterium]
MKATLIRAIHNLIYNNIFCSDPNSKKWNDIAANGYEKRIIGFRAEIEFGRLLANKERSTLQGGWLLSRQSGERCLEDSIYFTISPDSPDQYVKLYSLLERLSLTKRYFIKYAFGNNHQMWPSSDVLDIQTSIPYPSYSCYEFNQGKFTEVTSGDFGLAPLLQQYIKKTGSKYRASYQLKEAHLEFASRYLAAFSYEELQHILASRFIFDGLLGFTSKKGIPNDIDLVVLKDNKISFIEVKEKDRAKTVVGFGMDTAVHLVGELTVKLAKLTV